MFTTQAPHHWKRAITNRFASLSYPEGYLLAASSLRKAVPNLVALKVPS